MDEFNQEQLNHTEQEELELGFSDKIVGIFTEPALTYGQVAKFPPKTIDWLLPFFILLLIVIGSQFLMMSNPIIKADALRQQREAQEKFLEKEVQEGKLTKDEAEKRMEFIEKQMEQMSGTVGLAITSISILVMGFIIFFFVVLVYYLISKFTLKGEGTYSSALVASGLTSYIGMIQVVLATILSIVFDRMIRDTSVASLMNSDKTELAGFMLSKLDPISIWTYIVLGIGLAKMFKSDDIKKYVTVILAVWIGWSIITFILSRWLPFLSNM